MFLCYYIYFLFQKMEFDPGFHKEVAKTMEYRRLGKTDMMVSKISLGGASFGINCLFSYHENLLRVHWLFEFLISQDLYEIPTYIFEYHRCRISCPPDPTTTSKTANPNFRHSSFDRTKGSNKGHEIFESIIQHEF